MNKAFPIDFVRQLIDQTMLEEHLKNPSKYFGGENQVSMFSFYEQLQTNEEVDRYTEIYRDLTKQQNRTGLILNGTILAPENPTLTNINTATIVPMSFTCAFRLKLKNRDMALDTINNLFNVLKGRSHDIAEFDNGKLFKVGTVGNNVNGKPLIKNGDYLGYVDNVIDLNTKISALMNDYGFVLDDNSENHYYYYTTANNRLCVAKKINGVFTEIVDDGTYHNVIFPQEHNYFEKWKVSISFESMRIDEPRVLNSEEYCVISFGGSATLVNANVMLGNNMSKLGIKKTLIRAKEDIEINEDFTWLEPLEMPSSSNADTQVNQLVSNKFIQNTHTDALTLSMQYSFVLDKSIDLLKQWFKYARYGIQADGNDIPYTDAISPNMIYTIRELWCSWGEVEQYDFYARIVESIDIENTESDTLSIVIPFQLQGEND